MDDGTPELREHKLHVTKVSRKEWWGTGAPAGEYPGEPYAVRETPTVKAAYLKALVPSSVR